MKTAFDPTTAQWKISWPGRIAQHDLVYLSPPEEPTQGIPLGNGDLGALAYTNPSQIIITLNKSDLWDDAPFGTFENWSPQQEEQQTTLRHAGQIIIDFKLPIFDPLYLHDFCARLSLPDATAIIRTKSAFGTAAIKLCAIDSHPLLSIEITTNLTEPAGLEVIQQRFGSRTFGHWYSQINPDPTLGLSGTKASADKDAIYITHKLTSGIFALATTAIAKPSAAIKNTVHHSRGAAMATPPNKAHNLHLLTTVTSPQSRDPIAVARQTLQNLPAFAGLIKAHKRAWKNFWLRSFMDFGDDYLNNLWHLAMYYANASQRGRYPGRFIDGLWGGNRDFRAWNFYFHWNQQQLYWPLNAAGHHDLVETYLEYRFASLPHARKDAREIFNTPGAFVSDVCDRRGHNSKTEMHNHTPVAQIALDFYRQYQYTNDLAFLHNRAIPFMLEAAAFIASLFTEEKDHKYHSQRGTVYEGWILVKDSITELSCAKALFTAVIEACRIAGHQDPRLQHWQQILDNLPELATVPIDPQMLTPRNTINIGTFKNETLASDQLLAAGYGLEEKHLLTSMLPAKQTPDIAELDDIHEIFLKRQAGKMPHTINKVQLEPHHGIFPKAEYCPIFPCSTITLAHRDSDLFKAAVNLAKLYTPEVTGWDPLPIVLARLGLGQNLIQVLRSYPDNWQIHPNGFTHWGIRDNIKAENSLRFDKFNVRKTNEIKDTNPANARHHLFAAWPFRHASLEALYVLPTAMNEALLQSCDGTIRLAPAAHKNQNARFTLHAANKIVVSAQVTAGRVKWVHLKALRRATATIQNPWPETTIATSNSQTSTAGQTITIHLKSNQTVLLTPRAIKSKLQIQPQTLPKNQSPKTTPSGLTTLGIERLF